MHTHTQTKIVSLSKFKLNLLNQHPQLAYLWFRTPFGIHSCTKGRLVFSVLLFETILNQSISGHLFCIKIWAMWLVTYSKYNTFTTMHIQLSSHSLRSLNDFCLDLQPSNTSTILKPLDFLHIPKMDLPSETSFNSIVIKRAFRKKDIDKDIKTQRHGEWEISRQL